jgi:hypothetical protein
MPNKSPEGSSDARQVSVGSSMTAKRDMLGVALLWIDIHQNASSSLLTGEEGQDNVWLQPQQLTVVSNAIPSMSTDSCEHGRSLHRNANKVGARREFIRPSHKLTRTMLHGALPRSAAPYHLYSCLPVPPGKKIHYLRKHTRRRHDTTPRLPRTAAQSIQTPRHFALTLES